MIPDREQCLKILRENKVWENIQEHTKRVARNALFIGKKFQENGHKVNLKIIEAAGLLHDLCKQDELLATREKQKNGMSDEEIAQALGKENHADMAARKVAELGFPEISEPIKQHTMKYLLIDADFTKWSTEAVILMYSDQIDVEGKVDSIENAFRRYRKRYPYLVDRLNAEEPIVKKMEKYIFEKAKIKFSDLEKLNE